MPSDIALIISTLCLILIIPMLLIGVAYYRHQPPGDPWLPVAWVWGHVRHTSTTNTPPPSDGDTDRTCPYAKIIGNTSESEQVIKDK